MHIKKGFRECVEFVTFYFKVSFDFLKKVGCVFIWRLKYPKKFRLKRESKSGYGK